MSWHWRDSISRTLLGLILVSVVAVRGVAEDAPNTHKEPVEPLTPAEALASLELPEGFQATLFAAEPEVLQPIALTTDRRGRLWVAENNTYAELPTNFDLSLRDRIIILEDTNLDGQADRRTVFWDQGQRLSSVEVGFGGVWVLCAPELLFIPDCDGDDVPDGEPVVVLDGWEADSVRHNVVNGLKWGPDGWLYGRHGIQATSYVGKPGTPRDHREPVNCAIWRYHPIREVFEVVCRGTTNSWGLDWNEMGEPFFINTVIGHLWHAVPGAHFERMYGEDFNPYLYQLIGQTADHVHWDTAETWSDIRQGVSPTTDEAGGGHAHSGLLIYQGDNWPDRYRDALFTLNFHGRRVNSDRLERRGASYVARHEPDVLQVGDEWFRGIELISGPDGGVYIADWSDVGECHQNDGVHRTSGRIYKITYGQPNPPIIADVEALDDAELVRLQLQRNDWYVRQARLVLQERSASGRDMNGVHDALIDLYDQANDPSRALRALWALAVTGGTSEAWLLRQLNHENEHVRVWAIRFLLDEGTPSEAVVTTLTEQANGEPSGLVRLYLASALQRFPLHRRWQLAESLAVDSKHADDPVLPLMVWYGIEPSVPEAPDRAVALAGSSQMRTVSRFIARRLTQELVEAPESVDRLVALAAESASTERTRALLQGMAEALRGWQQAPEPSHWDSAWSRFSTSPDPSIRQLARELALVFGDGRAVEELLDVLTSADEDLDARRTAIRALVEARADGLAPVLRGLLSDRDLQGDAIRGLAAFDDPEITELFLRQYPRLRPNGRTEVIVALASRPDSSEALLQAIEAGTVERGDVPTFQIRQMQGFADPALSRRLEALWPELRSLSDDARERLERFKAKLTPEVLDAADLSQGRGLYQQSCGSCHVLFGQGEPIGPDLTGSQRSNLDYLLENLLDPSAMVADDYRMSTIALADGRVLNGIISGQTEQTLTLQTANERFVLRRDEVEEILETDQSLMPEGQLDILTDEEIRDLIGYLMSPRQVPLPEP